MQMTAVKDLPEYGLAVGDVYYLGFDEHDTVDYYDVNQKIIFPT